MGNEALIATNRSGDLVARISSANQGKMKEGDDAMMFIRPEAFAIARMARPETISSPRG